MTSISAETLCPICSAPLRPWLPEVTDPQSGERFAIRRCGACGLGRTVPPPDDLALYYGPAYYDDRHGFTAAWCIRRRLRWISAAVGGGVGKRLLDIGCGDGAFLLAARDRGWRTVGIERNPEPARRTGLDVRGHLEEADDGGAPYDCITLWHGLEHMHDPRTVLQHIAGLLRPGGLLVVAVPDAGGLQCRIFGRRWLHLDVPRHLYHFDAASLRQLLLRQGFAVRRQMHQEFEYDLLGWVQSALNMLLPVPNLFFDTLTHRPRVGGKLLSSFSTLLGLLLAVPSLPLVAAGTLSRRGGTLVVLAHKSEAA